MFVDDVEIREAVVGPVERGEMILLSGGREMEGLRWLQLLLLDSWQRGNIPMEIFRRNVVWTSTAKDGSKQKRTKFTYYLRPEKTEEK